MSHFVKIYTRTKLSDQDMKKERPARFSGDVKIENYCWIGAGVFISPGTTIGENCVVGANSVVTRNLPPHSVCAGAPAKVIRFKSYLKDFEKESLACKYWCVLSDSLKEKYMCRKI